MVPPEGIDKIAPTTLPADFGEWDSGDTPEAQPAEFNGFNRAPAPVAPPKPVAKSATARVAVLPAADRAPSAPPRKPVKRYPDPKPVFEPPQAEELDVADLQQGDESKGKQKKMLIAVGAVAILLVAGGVTYRMRSSKAVTPNQPVASQAATTLTTSSTTFKPEAATTTTTSPVQTATTPAQTPAPEPTLGKQSEIMKSQLNAPSRISSDLKALGANQAAPNASFSPAGMDMGNGNGVFNSGNGPKVKVEAPKKVTISNGIAVGLLVQKTAPSYPPIAKSARVQGTVVIQATISKNGTIENSHAVSGPTMLRQAALDAVKTWRFRPYLLDGEPVEVETTVNVVFNLGG
jgi:protein TonB